MNCANSDQELNNDAKFCFRCGTKIQEDAYGVHQDEKGEHSSVVCPKCEQYDRIEKISSIVKSQTRSRENTEWVTETYADKNGKEQVFSYPQSHNVVETTDLAKRLSPPPRPQAKSFSGCLIVLGVLLLIIAFFSLVAESFGILLFYLIPGLLIFMAKRNHDNKEQARVHKEQPPWKDAMEVWSRLYYCYRDDIVFDGDNIKNTCRPQDVVNCIIRSMSHSESGRCRTPNPEQAAH